MHSGTKALQGAASSSDNAQCSQTITVQPGHTYTLAGWVQVTVTTDSGVTMTVATQSRALATGGHEPDWMLRCRLRLQLADGTIQEVPDEEGSAVEVSLP